jgi:hypothetical protein
MMAGAFLGLVCCSRGTYLSPLDRELLSGAARADAFIVTRQDGGAPSAVRALAGSACASIAKVERDAKLEAGVCP